MSTTERLFWQDPYLLEFDARVTERREHEGRPAVVLDRTAFYAESGGQPWDTGTLDGVRVTAVIEDGDVLVHVLDAPLGPDTVHGRVDEERRRDHRQQHHGQHLLSRVLLDLAGADTVSFHLGSETCSIDLDKELSEPQLREAARRANHVVWEARPVRVLELSRSEALEQGVTPSDHVGGTVRVVEVEGFDKNPCGGTHPRSTAEVGVIVVLGSERYKAGARVFFVCGDRALSAIDARNRLLADAASALSAPLAELGDAARKLVERAAASDKRSRELLDWALDGEARRLLADNPGSPAAVVRAFDGWPAQDVRTLAIKLTRLGPCVALLGSRSDKVHLVFAQTEGLPHDVGALLKDALLLVGGRGGGRGNLVQGGGERKEALDEALAAAAARLRKQA